MKMFFEEYGMVIVVMLLAMSIVTVSRNFASNFEETLQTKWEQMVDEVALPE